MSSDGTLSLSLFRFVAKTGMPFWSNKETFDPAKVKANIKMAISRIRLQQNKIVQSVKQQRRQLAELLSVGKIEGARIKVEALIREDISIEGLEVLAMLCELVANRLQMISSSKECPTELKEGLTSVLWAGAHLDNVPELRTIQKYFADKYGKEFLQTAVSNSEFSVNDKIISRLGSQTPSNTACVEYIKAVAAENGIDIEEEKLLVLSSIVPTPTGMDPSCVVTARNIPPIVVPRDELEARLLALKRQ
jgi:vacuolar protein sorting-associated protein IST1